MGWAGPAQPTGPDSAQKVLGRFRPKMDWADFGPNTIILFWARPGPEEGAGPGPTWPSDRRWRGGNYFPPHPPACRTLFVLHAKGKKETGAVMKGGRRITWRGGGGVWLRRWRCCGGGRWRCLGSRTAAPSSGATPSNDGVTVFFQVFLPVSSFPFLYFGSSPFRFVLSSLWFLLFSLLFFFVFLSSRFLSSFGPLSFGSPSPFSPFFFLLLFFGLFIEPKGGAFYGCTWGARAAAVGRPFGCSCRGSAPCFSGRRAAGGRPVSSVGGPTAWGFGLVASRRERPV